MAKRRMSNGKIRNWDKNEFTFTSSKHLRPMSGSSSVNVRTFFILWRKKNEKKFILFKGQQWVQYNNMPSGKYPSLKTTEQRWE